VSITIVASAVEGSDFIRRHASIPFSRGMSMSRKTIEGQVPKDEMIQPEDVAGAVRYLLSTSPACHVPEVQFVRAGDVY
jgi:NADP-dependent 3-hydroxy acid dehydrogenase YdfG